MAGWFAPLKTKVSRLECNDVVLEKFENFLAVDDQEEENIFLITAKL